MMHFSKNIVTFFQLSIPRSLMIIAKAKGWSEILGENARSETKN